MSKPKPYTSKSLPAAIREVRRARRLHEAWRGIAAEEAAKAERARPRVIATEGLPQKPGQYFWQFSSGRWGVGELRFLPGAMVCNAKWNYDVPASEFEAWAHLPEVK